MAIDSERWQARAEDPQSRRVLAAHFRMSLIETNAVGDDSALRADRNDPAVSVADSLFREGEHRFPNYVGPNGAPSNTSNQKMSYR
jgi:hypothetical protein